MRAGQISICAAAAIAAVLVSSCGREIPDCPTPTGFTKIALPSGLPATLREELKPKIPPEWPKKARESIGDISMPGGPFDATDSTSGSILHNRRYIFVWNRGIRWVVAMEEGGIAYNQSVSVYELNKDNNVVRVVKKEYTHLDAETVCEAAARIANEQS